MGLINKKAKERIERVTKHGWQILDLKNCGLTEIPAELFEHRDIVSIDISNDEFCDEQNKNRISIIPDQISNFKNLVSLHCARNEIKVASPKISELKKLKKLDLTDNLLTDLPHDIANMSSLTELKLGSNKFEMLPPEIVARGIESIRNFYKELQEKDFLYEVKLIIVGEGRVGKTCLSEALIDKDYKLKDEDSTEGINIQKWVIHKDEIKQINSKIERDFQINIWDFGGQEIYHSTHQFFLTKRSIYMMITESRKEDNHDDFFYWLNIIKLLGDNSPVCMVLNKCDQPTKEIPIKEYKESFDNIIDFDKISLKDDFKEGFNNFRNKLIKYASQLPHIGTPLPKVWVDIRQDIERLKVGGKDIISTTEYLELCKNHYRDYDSAMFLSEYFHDLGVFLHFKDDIVLKDVVILNHEWITVGVYKILDDQTVKDNKGRFTLDDLDRLLKDEKYRNNHKEVLSLMKNTKFDLCFELSEKEFLVPRLLPVDEIDFDWSSDSRITKFEYKYQFMPKGILTRLIVKLHKDIYKDKYWRHGVILQYEDTKALIREKYFENKISIELIGNYRKEFLSIIRKAFNEIHSDYNKLKVSEMIPCICEDCLAVNNPTYYEYNLLRRYELNNRYKIVCDISLKDISVLELTENVILDEIIQKQKIIYCENKNAELLNALEFENIKFHPQRDSNGVFVQMKANPNMYGLRDRDFLLDSEVTRLKTTFPNYFILEYYCFENYVYHPENLKEILGDSFDVKGYRGDIVKQKNEKKIKIISNFKQARKGYQEFQVERDKFCDKEKELDVSLYLESNDLEVFFKSYSMKDHYDKTLIAQYSLSPKELTATKWFREKVKLLVDIN